MVQSDYSSPRHVLLENLEASLWQTIHQEGNSKTKGTPQVNKSAGSREREVVTAPVMSNDYVAVLQPHLNAA